VLQKTARNNITSTVLIFFFFSAFSMEIMGGKITINSKELHWNRKKKKHMHIGKKLEAH